MSDWNGFNRSRWEMDHHFNAEQLANGKMPIVTGAQADFPIIGRCAYRHGRIVLVHQVG